MADAIVIGMHLAMCIVVLIQVVVVTAIANVHACYSGQRERWWLQGRVAAGHRRRRACVCACYGGNQRETKVVEMWWSQGKG